jgi:polysaccharide biosynthesis protein PslH
MPAEPQAHCSEATGAPSSSSTGYAVHPMTHIRPRLALSASGTTFCVVSLEDPWVQSHGGSIRTRLFVEAAVEAGCESHVIYVADGPSRSDTLAVQHPITRSLPSGHAPSHLGRLKRHYVPMPTMRGGRAREIERLITDLAPDVLLVSQLRAAPYIRRAPRASLWLDQADVWSSFIMNEINARRGLARPTASAQRALIERQERKWAGRAAVVTAAGWADADHLRKSTKQLGHWLPSVVPGGDAERGPEAIRTAGLLANFGAWSNRDAFSVLRDHWAPVLRQQGWRIVVAGYGSTDLDAGPLVDVLGELATVKQFYQEIDVALAPIRLGGGVKVKVIEALRWRKGVVATPAAVEELPRDLALAIPVVVAERPVLEAAMTRALEDKSAIDLAEQYFTVDKFNATFCDVARDLP